MTLPAELAHSAEDFYMELEPMETKPIDLIEAAGSLPVNPDEYSAGDIEVAMAIVDSYLETFVTASIKLRNDHGPDGTLSEPQEFVLIDGLYYPVRWIKSGQGLRREQLAFNQPERAKEG